MYRYQLLKYRERPYVLFRLVQSWKIEDRKDIGRHMFHHFLPLLYWLPQNCLLALLSLQHESSYGRQVKTLTRTYVDIQDTCMNYHIDNNVNNFLCNIFLNCIYFWVSLLNKKENKDFMRTSNLLERSTLCVHPDVSNKVRGSAELTRTVHTLVERFFSDAPNNMLPDLFP